MLRPGSRSCPLGSHRTGFLRCRRCRYSTSRLLSVARIVSAQSGWSESSEERYTLAHTSVDPDRKGRPMPFTWMRVVAGTLFWVLFAQPGGTQQATAQRTGANWPMYRYDFAGTGYSPLAQIDTRNVANLTQAWTYSLQSDAPTAADATGRGGPAGLNSEATTIIVDGGMYVAAADRGVAVQAGTGRGNLRHPASRW